MHDFDRFMADTRGILPGERICTDDMLVHAYAVDASPYEARACAVLDIVSVEELVAVFAAASRSGISLTMRGSGTAVSGQATAEEVLLRLRGACWQGIDVLQDGLLVRARCGVRGAEINNALAPYGRYITADPATLATATIGAMTVNNSAGLSCTVPNNIFHKLRDLELILADGTYLDTADAASVSAFRKSHAGLLDELARLRGLILSRPELEEKVRRKYRIRNTCGYSLNAFTDYDDPVEILKHIMVGSEGTLGFILSTTLETAPVTPLRATAMVAFHTMDATMQAVVELSKTCDMYACEFFDDPTLRSLAAIPGFPAEFVPSGEKSDECALLMELRTRTEEERATSTEKVLSVLSRHALKATPQFTTDPAECARLWSLRSALFPAIVGSRKPTEFAYTEDYCVPIEKLPEACHAFVEIMHGLGFSGGVSGHALHGNLHCALCLETGNERDVQRLASFIEQCAEIVLRLGGSLKGEHGTGRAITPFVRMEWGDELYDVMKRTKAALDPVGILNRDIVLNDNPRSHVEGLKPSVPSGHGLDRCVDCGFCEAACPSAEVGLSPRQRVYVMRELARMKAQGDDARAAAWKKSFARMGVDLCATDGLCTRSCPLQINVAQAMRSLRHDALTDRAKRMAETVRTHLPAAVGTASALLDMAAAVERLTGPAIGASLGRLGGRITGMTLPDLNSVHLCGGRKAPRPVSGTASSGTGREKIVYFPSCAVRAMGYSGMDGRKADPLMDTAVRLMEKAGYDVVIPHNVAELCCGKAFETKGMFESADAAAAQLNEALLQATEGGRWPVMCDTSPCLARMRKTLDQRLVLEEPVAFTLNRLADRLVFSRKHGKVAIHPTCSTRDMGLAEKMLEVARLCAEEVVMPTGILCCGFSGDKGMTRPELNASALAGLAAQVAGCEAGFSTSRTCEIGLTMHGGIRYANILYLIDECSSAR